MTNNEQKAKCYQVTPGFFTAAFAGVQARHAQHELDRKYAIVLARECPPMNHSERVYHVWDETSKVMVHLSVKNMEELSELYLFVSGSELPWATFNEDKPTLCGLMTALAFVLPPHLACWEPIESVEKDERLADGGKAARYFLDVREYQIARLIHGLPLAR